MVHRFDLVTLTFRQRRLLKRLIDSGSDGLECDPSDKRMCKLISFGFAKWITGSLHVATALGQDYFAYCRLSTRAFRRESVRYWITTGIAIAALLKSFEPEIRAVWAWLLQLSGQ